MHSRKNEKSSNIKIFFVTFFGQKLMPGTVFWICILIRCFGDCSVEVNMRFVTSKVCHHDEVQEK